MSKPRPKHEKRQPIFIAMSEMVYELRVADGRTIDRWVADGTFPPPHSRPGARKALWLRRHFDAYVADGYWPKEAFWSND